MQRPGVGWGQRRFRGDGAEHSVLKEDPGGRCGGRGKWEEAEVPKPSSSDTTRGMKGGRAGLR